jgi:hypothetical protein
MEITCVEQSILEVFRSIKTAAPNRCATELHCEGWLLRLALTAWSNGIGCLPFAQPRYSSPWSSVHRRSFYDVALSCVHNTEVQGVRHGNVQDCPTS